MLKKVIDWIAPTWEAWDLRRKQKKLGVGFWMLTVALLSILIISVIFMVKVR